MVCAAMVILFSFLLLGCDCASDPPSSSSLKHDMTEVHVRKLLSLDASVQAAAAGNRKTAAAPIECSEELVQVSQAEATRWLGGMPSYSVTITNTCASCAVRDVHVSCGEFGSAKLVDPSSFRRVTAGDCLVMGGAAMQPGESISFDYSNMYQYHLDVTSVSCTCN